MLVMKNHGGAGEQTVINGDQIMELETLYKDSLIKIENSAVTFYNYNFPSCKGKIISMDQIKSIQVKKPSIWNGKFRISGTGSFKRWFPADDARPSRDRIFVAKLKNKWTNIGFTVENSNAVETIFNELGLIK